jgi:hypothetical protein
LGIVAGPAVLVPDPASLPALWIVKQFDGAKLFRSLRLSSYAVSRTASAVLTVEPRTV